MATTRAIVSPVRTTATMASRLRPRRARSLICAACAGASVVDTVVPFSPWTIRHAVFAEAIHRCNQRVHLSPVARNGTTSLHEAPGVQCRSAEPPEGEIGFIGITEVLLDQRYGSCTRLPPLRNRLGLSPRRHHAARQRLAWRQDRNVPFSHGRLQADRIRVSDAPMPWGGSSACSGSPGGAPADRERRRVIDWIEGAPYHRTMGQFGTLRAVFQSRFTALVSLLS